jgi:hypothetical protein
MQRGVAILGALVASSCLVSIGDSADDQKSGSGGSAGATGGQAGAGAQGGQSAASGHAGQAGQSGTSGASGGTAGADGGSSGTGGTGAVAAIPGLLGHWPFDDGSGTKVSDTTSLARHGALPAAGVAWTTDAVFGKALEFSAPSVGVSVPAWWNTAFPATGTLLVWVKGNFSADEPLNRNIFDSWDSGRDHLFIRRTADTAAIEIQCALQRPSTQYAFVKGMAIENGTWQLVGIGWNASAKLGYCYLHGARYPGTVQGDWSLSDQAFVLGNEFIGVMDDVRLYDHMLTDDELALILASAP